jgi:cysteine desulfurase
MYVNNETGVIQPIKEIAAFVKQKGALFMTDATQAVGKIEIDVNDLGIDLLCFSGHKMYAPKELVHCS